MSVEIRVPSLGELVTEATVARWFKQVGETVNADEPIVELETDKVTLEFNAPASGTLAEIVVEEGGEVEVGALLGSISQEAGTARPATPAAAPPAAEESATDEAEGGDGRGNGALSPAVRKLLEEHGLDPSDDRALRPQGQSHQGRRSGGGRGEAAGRTLGPRRSAGCGEARRGRGGRPRARGRANAGAPCRGPGAGAAVARQAPAAQPEQRPHRRAPSRPRVRRPRAPAGAREERVKMTRLRRRIAERLKEAQNTAAMLTTYNEADMSAVMALRQRYRESFEKKHGVRLGFMSFFVKAAINALQAFPAVNAEIDGDEIVYKHHYDIGVAVGTPSGLVVPVVRDADRLGFAEIEKTIGELGARARDGSSRWKT